MSCTCPFVDVWNALWEMAESNPDLTTLIRPSNRIKFTDTLGPKKEITEGDLPELALMASGAEINIKATSTSSKITRKYTWNVATGEYDLNRYYQCIVWELYRAMFQWDTVLCALEWPSGWNYVTNVQIMTMDEGTAYADENRGIVGWAAMMQLDVEMHFSVDNLRIT